MPIYQMEKENPSKKIMGLLHNFKLRRCLHRKKKSVACMCMFHRKKMACLCAHVYLSVYSVIVEGFSFEKAISAKLAFFSCSHRFS